MAYTAKPGDYAITIDDRQVRRISKCEQAVVVAQPPNAMRRRAGHMNAPMNGVVALRARLPTISTRSIGDGADGGGDYATCALWELNTEKPHTPITRNSMRSSS